MWNRSQSALLTEADIDRMVSDLRALEHKSAWDRFLGIGSLVFERLMRGNEAEWHAHRSRKSVSLRRLVRHPACPFKKTVLAGAVNVHLFVRHNPRVLQLASLTPTHVVQVVGLPNERALELLQVAAESHWTVRELSAQVKAMRRQAGERRGRPPSPAVHKAETMARRAAAALRRMLALTPDSLDPSAARSLRSALDEVADLVSQARATQRVARPSMVVMAMTAVPAPLGDADAVAG
jgi:hypothetical protein